MTVFNDANDEIYHTDGSRIVWSTTRRPALLIPESAVTLTNFDVSFPDFAKSNCYAYVQGTDGVGFVRTSCLSMTSINPQEWDSGLSFVCNLPSGANYFETEITLSRITTPTTYLDNVIPDVFGSGTRHMPDGNAAIVEAIGPIVRMFSLERSGNAVYLRRKQSVANDGQVVGWNTPNNNEGGPGIYGRSGWTYGGDPNAWPSYFIDDRNTGSLDKRRGQVNQCDLTDYTNYASLWRGTLTVTPGYIAP